MKSGTNRSRQSRTRFSVTLGFDPRMLFERLSGRFPGYADLFLEILPDCPDRLASGSGRRHEGEVSSGADRWAVA